MSENPFFSDDLQAQLTPRAPTVPATTPVSETSEVAAQAPDAPISRSSTDPAMDEAAKQEFLWHTHEYLSEYARYADTKAAFAGAIASALLGALYSAGEHIPLLRVPHDQWALTTWLGAIGGGFLLASIVLAVWTVFPRLRSTQSKGFIYWGSIAAHGNMNLLQTSFHSQSARTLNDHLLHHVFDISTKVSIPKYRAVSLCIVALCIGGGLAAAALIFQDVPHKAIRNSAPAVATSSSAPQR